MPFRVIDRDWFCEFTQSRDQYPGILRIVCPFIKRNPLSHILPPNPKCLRVITRLNLPDFSQGVSDTNALRHILNQGGAVRGIKQLHTKLYIFGDRRAIITSANLTTAALSTNPELGVCTEDEVTIEHCLRYFHRLWDSSAQTQLSHASLDWIETQLDRHHTAHGALPPATALPDYGAHIEVPGDHIRIQQLGVPLPPALFSDPTNAFIKTLGPPDQTKRFTSDCPTISAINRDTCHYALTYSKRSFPKTVPPGAIAFISYFVKNPNDRLIFGRAITLKRPPDRNYASEPERQQRCWKDRYPCYIWIHTPQFIDGTLKNGVSLNELRRNLSHNSFAPTQRTGGDPSRYIMNKTHLDLSNQAFQWLNTRLQQAFDAHGIIPWHDLDQLDQPDPPVNASHTP